MPIAKVLQRVLPKFVRGFVNELTLMDSMILSPFSHLKNQKQPVSPITLGNFEEDFKEWLNDRLGIIKHRRHDYLETYRGSKGHPIGTVSISDSPVNCWDHVSFRQRKLKGKMKASTFDMTQYFSLQYVCNAKKYFLKFLLFMLIFFELLSIHNCCFKEIHWLLGL